jgi:hypothetical protein
VALKRESSTRRLLEILHGERHLKPGAGA